MDFSTFLWSGPFPIYGVVCLVSFIVTICVNISELIANIVDPDQTPRAAAPDLCLHCLTMSLFFFFFFFVLRFYGQVNPIGSCRARSVYLSTLLLHRLSLISG